MLLVLILGCKDIPCCAKISCVSLSLLLCDTKDYRSLEDISDAALRKMSGNGMHVGCAAFTCLIAMVCISDKDL